MKVSIEVSGSTIVLRAPYHPKAPEAARKLGGKWSASKKEWVFDARDEPRVRELCLKIYGTDGSPEAVGDTLTIRAPAKICDGAGQGKFEDRPMSYWLAGREIARAFDRDSGATLGNGVVLITGSFGSGGSRKNPSINYAPGTIFEVRDVPRAIAESVHSEYHGVTLLDSAGNVVAEATAPRDIEPAPATPSEIETLEAELAAIEARAAEIKTRIAALKAEASDAP